MKGKGKYCLKGSINNIHKDLQNHARLFRTLQSSFGSLCPHELVPKAKADPEHVLDFSSVSDSPP